MNNPSYSRPLKEGSRTVHLRHLREVTRVCFPKLTRP